MPKIIRYKRGRYARKTKYQQMTRLQLAAITTCLLVSVVALVILWYVIITTHAIVNDSIIEPANAATICQQNAETPPEESQIPETEETEAETQPANNEEMVCPIVEEQVEVNENELLPNLFQNVEENLTQWFKTHDTLEKMAMYKRTDFKGNLFIALVNPENGENIVTFIYTGYFEELYERNVYPDWVPCNRFLDLVSGSDVCDLSYNTHHEVSANNLENAQISTVVPLNRVKDPDFPLNENYSDDVRGVITDPGQYVAYKWVIARRAKSDHYLEKQDVEKCFRQTVLVLADELIRDVPEDVVFAASFLQGSGEWDRYGKTIYCHK